jgi:hypothetical protein
MNGMPEEFHCGYPLKITEETQEGSLLFGASRNRAVHRTFALNSTPGRTLGVREPIRTGRWRRARERQRLAPGLRRETASADDPLAGSSEDRPTALSRSRAARPSYFFAYLDALPAKLVGMAPVFRNRSDQPDIKDIPRR